MSPAHAEAAALAAFLAALAVARAAELTISARHARALASDGAREFGRGHFPLIVTVHALFPLALALEVLRLGSRPVAAWPAWLALWIAAFALKVWAIRSLGTAWNVRVWVVPGLDPIRRGPYRWIAHPNYLAVATEFAAAPMMFGAWRTAIAFSALNALLMAIRIPAEASALRWAAMQLRGVAPRPDRVVSPGNRTQPGA